MRTLISYLSAVLICLAVSRVSVAAEVPAADAGREAFADAVDLSPLKSVAVQHAQTIKTLDSFCREMLSEITGKSSYEGHDAVYTLLDATARPEVYRTANMIKIHNPLLATEFRRVHDLDEAEQERIVKEGMVSLALLQREDVQRMLQMLMASDARKAQSIQQLGGAAALLADFLDGRDPLLPANMVPPAPGVTDGFWHPLAELEGYWPEMVARAKEAKFTLPPMAPHYKPETVIPALQQVDVLMSAWRSGEVGKVNQAAVALAADLQQINPAAYPSHTKLEAEVVYNRLAKMTLPGAFCYFFAFVLFLMAAINNLAGVRLWAIRLFAIGYLIHTAGISIRWWLDGTIPIKNEFESVMFAAWFGGGIGLLLEMRFGRSIFGAGCSFVGWFALVALFAAPYVFHKSIGQDVGQVNGVLLSYWLYIHVTMVTCSYAMIAMSAMLSGWWLVRYYLGLGHGEQLRSISGDARGFDVGLGSAGGGGGGAVLGIGSTLARVLFFPAAAAESGVRLTRAKSIESETTRQFLSVLDSCNLVVLQLAFWLLGAGIVCGAAWADMSWGRPWGWDPKETFALVTWIVYLIIVHVRVTTSHKAWWTAVLSLVGTGVMLFNWIGVNYFLPGLHSYA